MTTVETVADIAVSINGRALVGKTGQTILEVALANGIEIPNLCYDARLKPTGACRLCLVQLQGRPIPVASCSTEIQPDMVVETETEEIRDIRKTIMELLFYEHRGSCTTCDENGNCLMQKYAYEYQVADEVLHMPPRKAVPNYTTGNKGVNYVPNKCIRCGRCVRICEEVQMDCALTFKERAAGVEVTTAFDIPLNDSTCELCGQCISTCPTGAMYEMDARGKGQGKDLVRTRSVCPYCGVGCRIDLNVRADTNEIVRVTSEVGCIPNNGNLCVKGRFGMDFVAHADRLTEPLIKRNGELEPASWDEALTLVADRLTETKKTHGPDAIAGLSSAKCTNEDNYVFQKFIRSVIGTNNVDHCARLCHASTVAGLARAFGSGAMTNSIDEIRHAECIFVIGSNTTEAHPVIGLAVKDAVVNNGAKLIVADPRRIDLVPYAEIHMQQKPGTDVALINALCNVVISEKLIDEDFVAQRTEDFDEFAAVAAKMTPEKAQAITTVDADMIRAAARMYAGVGAASIIYSMGITQHTTGTDNVLSLANLAMITGNIGKESAGVNPLRGQNNVQGACDLGALPNVYPGYQPVTDEAIKDKFEAAWNTKLSGELGLTVVEVMHGVEEGEIKALYIMGENPALSDPNLNRTRKALDEVEFLVVQDVFLLETAQYADVVLPAFVFAEKCGTFTNTERRVQLVVPAVAAPGQARNDWEIIAALADKMGQPMPFENAAAIMDEIASISPIYGGISHTRIDPVGLQWPCPDQDHPGTKFLHQGEFKRGKGKFHAVPFKDPDELTSKEYPFVLSTGRQLYQFHTGTLSRRSKAIDQKSPTGYVELTPADAAKLGVSPGDDVEVTTRRGTVVTPAKITADIGEGWLFMPFHFFESPANMLTNDALDPIAKIPEFKVCAAQVKAV